MGLVFNIANWRARDVAGIVPLLCDYYHPISRVNLKGFSTQDLVARFGELSACSNGYCSNPDCGIAWEAYSARDIRKTQDEIQRIVNEREPGVWSVIMEDPEMILVQGGAVQQNVYQQQAAQKKVIEKHVHKAPEVREKVVEEHVHIPEPVVQKKQIIERHLEPEVIKNEVAEHVYVLDPVVQVEKRTYVHQGGSVRQTSTVQYAESSSRVTSKTSKYAKDSRRSEYYSDESREGASRSKGKGKEKRRDHSRDSSRHDKKRSSSRPRRDDKNSKTKNSGKVRSHSRSRSRDHHRSSRKQSPRKDDSRRSDKKYSEKTSVRKGAEEKTSHGRESNRDQSKLPPWSAKRLEAAPPPTAEASRPKKDPTAFDPYNALGLQKDCDESDIKAAKWALIVKFHPDKHVAKSEEEQEYAATRSAELNRAWDILGNPERRAVYDRTGETQIWSLDEMAKEDKTNNQALVRSGEGGGANKGSAGLKGFFKKK